MVCLGSRLVLSLIILSRISALLDGRGDSFLSDRGRNSITLEHLLAPQVLLELVHVCKSVVLELSGRFVALLNRPWVQLATSLGITEGAFLGSSFHLWRVVAL